MNFFERQRQVRRLSVRLVVLFAIAVIGIVLVVDLVVAVAFDAFTAGTPQLVSLLVFTSVVVAAAIGLASLVRTAALHGGGGRVARELGGEYVPPDTSDPQLRRLRNVVEEMAIAAGVSVPEVYVLRQEQSINAFASGWSTSDAAVAVTQGALERLNRDELQGVVAHEFSHVVNGDMRLNIRLIGLLFGILFLSVIGRTLLQGSFLAGGRGRGRSGSNNPLPLIGIALLAAGAIGVLVGRVIQASVSRQREYLADTSAVQYTRQTGGIAGALKKIGGLGEGSKLRSPKRDEVGHMLFGPGGRFTSLFATHPPLVDRIRALEPSFDPAELERLSQRWTANPPVGLAEDAALGLVEPSGLPDAATRLSVGPAAVVDQVAVISAAAQTRAGAIIGQIPEPVLARARDVHSVLPLVLGLLMADDPASRDGQFHELAVNHGQRLADATRHEAEVLAGLHPLLRLPLAQLALPALRQRSARERQDVLVAVSGLIHADNRLSIFEYCLARLVYRELHEANQPVPRRLSGRSNLNACAHEVTTLLAMLAAAGNSDPAAAKAAFVAGLAEVLPATGSGYAPPPDGVIALEPGWPVLDELPPAEKERLVAAVVTVIGHDGVMSVAEVELLRTVCALLHCPLPPQLISAASG
ncbi:MAG: M48 family metallopeptidase [Micromonosporaceae bacterium]